MSVHVKICGLTTVEDALAAWRGGADLLGFIFVDESPRHVQPQQAAEIVHELRQAGCDGPIVGVFAQTFMADVARIADLVAIDMVQLHGDVTPDQAANVRRPVIVARRVRDSVPWDELVAYGAWAYLLDSHVAGKLGGTGHAWEYRLACEGRPPDVRLILAGGLDPGNVADAVRAVRPWGVDVASGVEASPGRKDVLKMRAFIREAKGA